MGRADQHILDAGALWQRGDEQDSGGDILRLEHLTPFLSARWQGTPVEDWCGSLARRDGSGADIVLALLEVGRLSQREDGRLGGAVVRAAQQTGPFGGDRCDVDDRAFALPL